MLLIILTNEKGGFEFLRLLHSASEAALHEDLLRYKCVLHSRIAQSAGLKPCSEGAACPLID